jgi:ribosomal protein L37AE/L43A
MTAASTETCPYCGGQDVHLRLLTSYDRHWSCDTCRHTWREPQTKPARVEQKDAAPTVAAATDRG